MSGVAHLLDASITSALALKPSTVYVVCVENSKTHAKWHLRKCFSEFCELREKVIALIDGTSAASSTSSTTSTSPGVSSSASTSGSFDSNSHTSSSSSGSESGCSLDAALASSSSSSNCDRFPFIYKQFPRRQLFGSRSKRVIEQRTHALNAFLRNLLLYVREVKQQNQIAVYFSLMNFVEAFFECASHGSYSASQQSAAATATTFNFNTFSLNSPSTLARTQAAAAAAARAAVAVVPQGVRRHHHHHSPFSYNDDDEDDDDDRFSDCESAAKVGSAEAVTGNNFNFARRFYQEYGHSTANRDGSTDDDDSDDEETKLVLGLKKTSSCIAHRELKEMKMHFSGSHYAPMQSTDPTATTTIGNGKVGGGRAIGMSASDAWAARIEIAGFSSAAASSGRHAQVQNSSKLAIGANRVASAVRHHPNHSSNKQKSGYSYSSSSNDNEMKAQSTQSASIVYATKQQQQPASSRAMLLKHKQLSGGGSSMSSRRAAREERPEWA